MTSYIIHRIWKKSSSSKISWTIWDMGNEFWELKGDNIRHFKVISRDYDSMDNIKESVILLHDSPIPLEASRQTVGEGWEVQEGPQGQEEAPRQQAPRQQAPRQQAPRQQAPRQEAPRQQAPRQQAPREQPKELKAVSHLKQKLTSQKQLGKKDQQHLLHESHTISTSSQSIQEKLEEKTPWETEYTNDLWSSLSQWIPPSALYQPSLHHLANLDLLSDTQQIRYKPRNLQRSHMPSFLTSGPLFV